MPAIRKVSSAQMEMLVTWMEGHPLQARATQLGVSQAKQHMISLWEALASNLNAVGDGVTKSAKEWRQYWSDKKMKVKRKGSDLKHHSSGTGGGPAWGDVLTPIEERILSLMGVQNVVGNKNVQLEVDMGLDDSPPPPPTPPPPPLPLSDHLYTPCPWLAEFTVSPPSVHEATLTGLSQAATAGRSQQATVEGLSQQAAVAGLSQAATAGPSIARTPKRRHNATRTSVDADNSPAERSRPHTAPPRWALELEERRIREEEARRKLEERRLAVEERRLTVEERRLAVEERRLEVEERRLALEEKILSALTRIGDNLGADNIPDYP